MKPEKIFNVEAYRYIKRGSVPRKIPRNPTIFRKLPRNPTIFLIREIMTPIAQF